MHCKLEEQTNGTTDLAQSLHETYRFAKLKSWAATTDKCTFKVSKDPDKHKLQKEQVEYSTEMVRVAASRLGSLSPYEILFFSFAPGHGERLNVRCTAH